MSDTARKRRMSKAETDPLNDGEYMFVVCFWDYPVRIHLVDNERRGRTKSCDFLDEQVTEIIVVARQVIHIHYFCRLPHDYA